MKVGILTYQNTLNYGAALQCYALYKSCKNLGVEAQIIDYRNKKIVESIRPISFVTKRGKKRMNLMGVIKLFFIYPLIKIKYNTFNKFNTKYMDFSNTTYYTRSEILKNPPIYDKYIIGSDQVWNYDINGMDTTYFMDFVKDKSKVFTFASSFGLDKIEKDKKNVYRDLLSQIPTISVREQKAADIIRDLIGKEVQVICDPVFLFSKEDWLGLIESNNANNDESVFTYFLNYNTREKFEEIFFSDIKLNKFKRLKFAGGIKIKDFISRKVEVNMSNGPIEFISAINKSKYIFTDSFHATVFSILLNKKFIVFLSGNKGRDFRIINLLEKFNLKDRIFDGSFKKLNEDINFDEINLICKKMRIQGIEFLKNNLKINTLKKG